MPNHDPRSTKPTHPPAWVSVLLLVVGVAGVILASLVLGPDPAHSATRPIVVGWHRPCPTEDSVGCFWNADHRGNNRGTSFHVNRRGWIFFPTRDIEGHDGCWIHVDATSVVRCDDGFRTVS